MTARKELLASQTRVSELSSTLILDLTLSSQKCYAHNIEENVESVYCSLRTAYLEDFTGTTPRRSKPSSVNVPVYNNCHKINYLNMP